MCDCSCESDPPERESRQTATRLADHLIDHPEDFDLALLIAQVAVIQEQIKTLTTEVHQHWP